MPADPKTLRELAERCEPPAGTKPGTMHELHTNIGTPYRLEWNGTDAWRMPGGPWVLAARIAELGGRYVGPVETRDG